MAGTSAAAQPIAKTAFVQQPKQNEEVRNIVRKMESSGLSLGEAFERIQVDRQGKLTIASFTRFINKWYPALSRDEVITLISSVDLDKNSLLDLTELQTFLGTYSTAPAKSNLRQTLKTMAMYIQRQNISTSAFFAKYRVAPELDMNDFETQVGQVFSLSRDQATQVFMSLDLKRQQSITLKDLTDVLNSYRTDKTETLLDPESEPAKLEPKQNKIVNDYLEVLKQNGLQPVHMYRFADKSSRNSVSKADFIRSMNKLLPSLPETLVTGLLELFPSDTITKEEYLKVFDSAAQPKKPIGQSELKASQRQTDPKLIQKEQRTAEPTVALREPKSVPKEEPRSRMATTKKEIEPVIKKPTSPEEEIFTKLSSICRPGHLAGTILTQLSGLQLSTQLHRADLGNLFEGFSDEELDFAYRYLDSHERGFVYLHTLATIADRYNAGSLGSFPLYQNRSVPKPIKDLMASLATNLVDFDKSAYQFYTSMGLQPEQLLTESQFCFKMQGEMTEAECKTVFNLVSLNGSVVVYHYISCIDSYCTPPKTTRQGSWSKASEPFSDKNRVKEAPPKLVEPVLPKPAQKAPARTIKGLDRRLSEFPDNSVEQAILKLKLYAQSNLNSKGSVESVFDKLDEDGSGTLNEQEFSLGLNRLKLGLTEKQKTDLKRIADRNQDGVLLYQEFIDFLYEFDFSERLDGEDTLNGPNKLLLQKALTNTGSLIHEIENYAIDPEKDYFRTYNPKWTTILNSEHAALKRCKELLEGVSVFKDPDFGPEEKGGATALYWTGVPPGANFPPPSELSWKSPEEWVENVSFFNDFISSNDVIQGSLGDCWFIGALSVLATRDELVRGSIECLTSPSQVTQETILGISKGVYPPIFHPFSRKGLYVLKFYKNSLCRYVIIDKRLPCFDQEGYEPSLVFGRNRDSREIWVALIEKAYAKLHGCYEALGGGLIDDGLVDMTGFVAEKFKINGKGGVLDCPADQLPAKIDEFWRKICNFKKDGTLMGCSVDGQGIETDVIVNGEVTGILARHAYSLLYVLEITNPKAAKGRHRLLRLRNPWGQREWNGKWSDGSPEEEANMDMIKRFITRLPEEERFDPEDKEDGSFFMNYKDWRTLYNNLYACVDFSDEWSGIRFKDEWTTATSGGVPTKPDKAMAERWAKNPQYIMDLETETEIFISLQQEDGRCIKSLPFPYEGYIKTACFSIMRLNKGENGSTSFDSSRIVKLSTLKLHREVSQRITLPPGRYSIVPATMNAGDTGKFFLSVYFQCDKKKISIVKRGEPQNRGEIIEEEEETSAEEVPQDVIEEMRSFISYLNSF